MSRVDTSPGPGTIRTEIDGAVATLVLDHPPLNVITDAMRAGILDALADLRARRVRAVVLTGAGERAFCAGADLRAEQALTPTTARAFLEADEAVLAALQGYPGAVVAAVNGHAYGGGFELALACDIRIAARSANLAGVGVKVGLIASTTRLTRLVGETAAKDLLLTGRAVDAAEAVTLGLVSRVVPDAELLGEARRWAATVAERAPLAVRASKETLADCARLPLEEALACERERFARVRGSRDDQEALRDNRII